MLFILMFLCMFCSSMDDCCAAGYRHCPHWSHSILTISVLCVCECFIVSFNVFFFFVSHFLTLILQVMDACIKTNCVCVW